MQQPGLLKDLVQLCSSSNYSSQVDMESQNPKSPTGEEAISTNVLNYNSSYLRTTKNKPKKIYHLERIL